MQHVRLKSLTCLGAYGYPVAAGSPTDLTFDESHISVSPKHGQSLELSYAEVADLLVSGPSATNVGGIFAGGGFGFDGALEGMAIAAALNALTGKSKINTYVSIVTNVGELHFHYSGMECGALRIELAGPYTMLRRLNFEWNRARLQTLELASLLRLHTPDELANIKTRLTSPIDKVDPAARQGICPSCKATIPLLSSDCPKCNAIFSPDAAWKVQPI